MKHTPPTSGKRHYYLFRGDDNYEGGPVGRTFGAHADEADIQSFADHVLRKESSLSSRYTSFTEELKVARRFSSAQDDRHVLKVEIAKLVELETQGLIKLWDSDQVCETMRMGPKRIAKEAADVRAAMKRNSEILIEGEIPAAVVDRINID